MAGFKSVATVERDKWACDTVRENKRRGHELGKTIAPQSTISGQMAAVVWSAPNRNANSRPCR